MSDPTFTLSAAELAKIVTDAVTAALASRPVRMSPAEKQRAYRERNKSVTEKVTLNGETVTNVTEKVTKSNAAIDLFGESEPLKPHKRIIWTPESGWQGITDEDRKQFTAAAPAVDIERALSASSVWLTANPAKAKANHYRFFVNWIARQQERGGDKPSNQTTNGNDRTTHRPPVTRNAAPLSSNQPSLDESGNRGCEVSGVPSAWGPRVGDDGEIEW